MTAQQAAAITAAAALLLAACAAQPPPKTATPAAETAEAPTTTEPPATTTAPRAAITTWNDHPTTTEAPPTSTEAPTTTTTTTPPVWSAQECAANAQDRGTAHGAAERRYGWGDPAAQLKILDTYTEHDPDHPWYINTDSPEWEEGRTAGYDLHAELRPGLLDAGDEWGPNYLHGLFTGLVQRKAEDHQTLTDNCATDNWRIHYKNSYIQAGRGIDEWPPPTIPSR